MHMKLNHLIHFKKYEAPYGMTRVVDIAERVEIKLTMVGLDYLKNG